MKVEFDNTPKDIEENPALKEKVEADNELKEMIVSYVGSKRNPENDEVTLEMVLEVMAEEFPDFVMPIAEENWIRGYAQALEDVDEGQKMMKEDTEKVEKEVKESD